MSDDGEDRCATCGHRRFNHEDEGVGPCTMIRPPAVIRGAAILCPCTKFLDARDLTFNLHEEAREDDTAHDVS